MAAPTEKDLENMQAHNQRLRERIAEAEAKAAVNVQEKSREIDAKLLEAETARLESRLAAAREQAKVSTIKEGSEAQLASAEDQKAVAEAGQTPAGVTVDTNPADKSAEEKE